MSELSAQSLPESDCKSGISEPVLRDWLGEHCWPIFTRWMNGQTYALCGPGDKFPCENPHGSVYYPWDVRRFLDGLPVID